MKKPRGTTRSQKKRVISDHPFLYDSSADNWDNAYSNLTLFLKLSNNIFVVLII